MAVEGLDNIGIAVRDLDAVSEFFADKLGLKVERDDSGEPRSASVYIGDHYLYIFESSGAVADVHRVGALTENTPGIDHISFRVSDVDREFEQLKARGVPFDGEPETMEDWGIRLVGFTDPESNRYYLVANL